MWHWVGDAVGALARMLERHDEKQVFLIGISTGALVLVIAVYLFEFLQRHALQENTRLIRLLSHCGILGRNILRLNRAARKARKVAHIALLVPAFRLQRGRDEFLLALCFGMYYLLNPLVTLAMLVMFPRTWLLILLTAYLNAEVFSRIWIPSGDAIAAREAGANNIASRTLLLVVASCFYCGLAPMLCLLLGIYLGNLVFLSFETSMLLSLLPPLIWQPVSRVNGYSKDRERVDSEGYLWLPVIATSTLIPLQLLARYAVQKIRVPAIIVLAAKDQVVDNETTRYLLKRNEFVEMPELSHGDWTVKHQTAVLSTLSGWLERVHAAA